jgi:hypothetical protein
MNGVRAGEAAAALGRAFFTYRELEELQAAHLGARPPPRSAKA